MDASLLESINKARQSRQAVAVITDIETGGQHLVTSEDTLEGALKEEVSKRFRSAKSGVVSLDGKETFIQVHVPSPRLVIIGAVHISQALVPMAKSCEFDITVIDPRTAFASEERFPGVDLLAEWPQEVLEDRPLDAFTAMVSFDYSKSDENGNPFVFAASNEEAIFQRSASRAVPSPRQIAATARKAIPAATSVTRS